MNKNILVIDDNYAVRKSFTISLLNTEFQVDTAYSGENALKKFEAGKYGLIFLDLKMPGLSGIDTIKQIRKIDKKVFIYIITAFYQEFLKELNQIIEEGHEFELLQKPIDDEKIIHLTEIVLNFPLENVKNA